MEGNIVLHIEVELTLNGKYELSAQVNRVKQITNLKPVGPVLKYELKKQKAREYYQTHKDMFKKFYKTHKDEVLAKCKEQYAQQTPVEKFMKYEEMRKRKHIKQYGNLDDFVYRVLSS